MLSGLGSQSPTLFFHIFWSSHNTWTLMYVLEIIKRGSSFKKDLIKRWISSNQICFRVLVVNLPPYFFIFFLVFSKYLNFNVCTWNHKKGILLQKGFNQKVDLKQSYLLSGLSSQCPIVSFHIVWPSQNTWTLSNVCKYLKS